MPGSRKARRAFSGLTSNSANGLGERLRRGEAISRNVADLIQTLWNGIRTWNEAWALCYRHDSGWRTVSHRDVWFTTGDALTEQLREKLWEIAVVTPRFANQRPPGGAMES